MAGIIVIEIELWNTRITPSADSLVGGQFIGIPQLTHIICISVINAVNMDTPIDIVIALLEQLIGLSGIRG